MNKSSNPVSLSLLVFGAYALVMGLVLLIAPELVLPLFGFVETTGTWVHVLGYVLCSSALYYLWAGRANERSFARLTVYTRFGVPVVLLALLGAGKVDHMVLLFGLVDAIGGIWTAAALWNTGDDRTGNKVMNK